VYRANIIFEDRQPLNMILDDGGDLTMVIDRYPELFLELKVYLKRLQQEFK
jgi:S-adenosylhomocysteine hydrolase